MMDAPSSVDSGRTKMPQVAVRVEVPDPGPKALPLLKHLYR
jgi:hypothetical protein